MRPLCAGFSGETDEEHAATVDLMRSTKYDAAFMFAYSQRDKTSAARHLHVRVLHRPTTVACLCNTGDSFHAIIGNAFGMIQRGGEPRQHA